MKKITYLMPKNPISYKEIIHKDFWGYGFDLEIDRSRLFAALYLASLDRDLLLEIIPISNGNIVLRTEYSPNDERIKNAIQSIENECTNEIYDMTNPLFWGFSSKNEFDHYLNKDEDHFYKNFIRSVAKNSPEFMLSDQDLQRYEIGKSLIHENPDLIFHSNKRNLLLRINANYRDQVLNLKFGETADKLTWCIKECQNYDEDVPF